MRVLGVLLLTLSSVTPASSVFVIIPGLIQQAGTGAFLSLLAAALVALAMAVVYAELASAFPNAGGEYALIGRSLSPFAGFVMMGMIGLTSSLIPAFLALGIGPYLAGIWPAVPSVPIAAVILAAATGFGILNIRVNAWVTGTFLLVEILALLVLTGLGFAHPARSVGDLLHPVMLSGDLLVPTPAALIGLATAVAVFAYNGFGAAVYFSEEMHDAPRHVARTILWALVLTLGFEFVPTTAVLIGAPSLQDLLASASPFDDFIVATGGHFLGIAVDLGIALAIVNAVIAAVLVNARLFYASGRDRIWPERINEALTRVHPQFHSPSIATLAVGAIGVAACFIPFSFLLVLIGTSVVVIYALLCLGAIAGRATGRTAHAAYRMPLFPLPPVMGLLALTYILYANAIDPEIGRPSLIATASILAVASVYCWVMRRRRGADWAPAPVPVA
jgi:amino acid transporter